MVPGEVSLTKRLFVIVWIGALVAISVLSWQSYRDAKEDTYATLYRESDAIYHFLMSVRSVFQQQFLQSELPLNKKTIGFLPAHAIPKISEQFARRWGGHHGVSVNTVSDRPRNPRNQADRYELEAMAWFRDHSEQQVYTREYRQADRDHATFLYASPMWVEASCLKCHGEREQAPATVQEQYDTAYGYQLGELRGVVSIRMSVEEIDQKIMGLFLPKLVVLVITFLLLWMLIHWVVSHYIRRPLSWMVEGIHQIRGERPEYRLPVLPGELGEVGQRFNQMVDQLQQSVTDLTGQKEVTDRIIDAMGESLLVIDLAGKVVQTNPQLLQLTGWDETHFIDRSVSELFVAEVEGQENVLSFFLGRLQQIHDQDHDQFHHALNEAPIPILVADITHHEIEGRIFLVNHAFEALSGIAAESLLGTSIYELFPVEDAEQVQQMLYRASGHIQQESQWYRVNAGSAGRVRCAVSTVCIFCSGRTHIILQLHADHWDEAGLSQSLFGGLVQQAAEGEATRIDRQLLCREGDPIPVQISGAPLYREGEEGRQLGGAFLVLHNLQALLNVESARQASRAKDDFLASMSHELRTPLTTIIGNSDLIDEENLNADQIQLLNSINVSGRSLLYLVNDILDFSKIQAGKFSVDETPFDLSSLLREMELVFAVRASAKGLRFAIEGREVLQQRMIGDQNRIGQILINLLGNAVKFTDRGHIWLLLSIEQVEDQEWLHFRVKDEGIGIAPEVQQRLFQPFEQADRTISLFPNVLHS